MCDPLTIGSLALSAGSIGANMIGKSQQDAERNRVMEAENQRQQQYQNQSTQLFNKSLNKVSGPVTADAVKAEAADRTAADSKVIDGGGNYVPVTGSAPQEVGQSIARATRQALARNKEQARLNANISAVGGVNQKNGIDLGRDAQWQSIFGGNMQRSANILPLELQDANRAGSGARGIGQILGLGSMATGMAGMAGGGPTWGSLFGSGGGAPTGAGFSPMADAMPHGTTAAPGFFTGLFR